ncbi:MAG: glycosyltransferase family 4 protein [Actinomycetota bacterium]
MTLLDVSSERATPPDRIGPAQRVLWYWPFARPEDMAIAEAFAACGDELLVEVLDRDAAPPVGQHGAARVTRDLPDVDRDTSRLLWPASRTATYGRRAIQRRRTIAAFEPDLVHYHYLNRFTDRLAQPRCTWVASVHDVEPHQPRLGRFEQRLLADLYHQPDGLVVHHRWLAERLTTSVGIDPSSIAVVPLPVFPVEAPSPRPISDRPMALLFGALRPNKGIEWMIDMMRRPELADHRLHIAGRGDQAYQASIAALADGQPNVTTELGYVTTQRKDELFREASVVVLPYETFSSQSAVLHDAYGHGRPVVVTDVGALGETVRHDHTGVVVGYRDDRCLADAVAAMSGVAGDVAATEARRVASEQTPVRMAALLRSAYDRFI